MNEWQEFQEWLFDGNLDSEIPEHLCKNNSKITHIYAIRIFRNNIKLNDYLNNHLNTYDLFSLNKKELFYFIKRCVIDFGVSRKTIPWFGSKKENKDKLFNKLKEKYPLLKDEEIEIIHKYVNDSERKDTVKTTLGIIKDHKKQKVKNKTKNKERDSLTNLVRENFAWIDL